MIDITIEAHKKKLKSKILIISSPYYKTPPEKYGGRERIAGLAYERYRENGYEIDIISKQGSRYHTHTFEQLKKISLKDYEFIISYNYDIDLNKYLDGAETPQVHLIVQNNFEGKRAFIKGLKHIKPYVLSKDQQKQYEKGLDIKYPIIPNGIDTNVFRILRGVERTNDIAFIGAVGQHKSPKTCLEYAERHSLGIDFYGPLVFRDDEEKYKSSFLSKIKKYSKGSLKGEIADREKVILLNTYKYFIFLPGVDKKRWVEPFGIAPLEAMACGCTVITQYNSGGHLSYCGTNNTIGYKDSPIQLDPKKVRGSVLDFDFSEVYKMYYPK